MENTDKQEILSAIAALSNKFDGLEGRFDGLETRFDRLETKSDGFESRFDRIEQKMDTLHEEAMDAIHMLSSSTDERFIEVNEKLVGLDAKIERTRVEMPTKDYIDRKFADYDADATARADRMFVRR